MNNLEIAGLYRLSRTRPHGTIFNAIAFIALTILGVGVFCVGIKPWGGVLDSAAWAGFIVLLLYIVWFILSRISGILNAIVMIVICFYGLTGKDGAVHHTSNISSEAAWIRHHSNGVIRELGGWEAYESKSDAELVQDYQSEVEKSWIKYGTFVNPWYTQERYNEAWQNFATWYSTHKQYELNSEGTVGPPEVPYLGTDDQIDNYRTLGIYSPNDKHHSEDKPKAFAQTPAGLKIAEDKKQSDTIQYTIEHGKSKMERWQAWCKQFSGPFSSPSMADFAEQDQPRFPQDYNPEVQHRRANYFLEHRDYNWQNTVQGDEFDRVDRVQHPEDYMPIGHPPAIGRY